MSEALRLWLSQELDSRHLSYRELARQAGVSNSLVSRILSDHMPASADFCIKVALALDVAPEKLLRLAGILPGEPDITESTRSPIAQEVLELLHNMPPEQRKEVLRYVRFLSLTGQDD